MHRQAALKYVFVKSEDGPAIFRIHNSISDVIITENSN